MSHDFDQNAQSLVRTALARESYRDDVFRLVDGGLQDARWLVSTQNGLFAVGDQRAWLVAHGWFFGLCRRGNRVFLFENCARRDRHQPMGRLVAFDVDGGVAANPVVLAKGLDAGCHQIAFIDDLLCVLDTAGQAVLRFTGQGEHFDTKRPFAAALAADGGGDYMHINAITAMAGGIAILAHNGQRSPPRASELILLDRQWRETGRKTLPEAGCHDIVEDSDGMVWHCASMSGDIICSDGRRVTVTPDRMTRGLAFGQDRILVGASVFGPRSNRDVLPGSIIMLDRRFRRVAEVAVAGPPAVIIAL